MQPFRNDLKRESWQAWPSTLACDIAHAVSLDGVPLPMQSSASRDGEPRDSSRVKAVRTLRLDGGWSRGYACGGSERRIGPPIRSFGRRTHQEVLLPIAQSSSVLAGQRALHPANEWTAVTPFDDSYGLRYGRTDLGCPTSATTLSKRRRRRARTPASTHFRRASADESAVFLRVPKCSARGCRRDGGSC